MTKKILLLSLLLYGACTTLPVLSQTVEPFSLRYQTAAKGSIDFVSNAILECNGSGTGGANCGDLATELPPTFNSWSQNNDHVAAYIDIDTDPATFSSSSDSLYLPDCSNIAFAGIYWGGRSDVDDPGYPARDSILISANGGGYINVEAETLIDAGAAEGLGNRVYYCFADITDFVQSNPIKSEYTVANIYSRLQAGSNRWGGWNIVVVYRNDLLPMRDLNVFDGLVNVNSSGTNVEIAVTDFLTPLSGPVTFEVGVYGYDGDRGFVGDSLLFDGGSGFVPISNALNPAADIFNFSQTKAGVASTSQTPLIHNNISIDADIFEPDNSGFAYIGNSETSATVRITTNNETVQVQAITLAMDVYEPDIRSTVRVEDIDGGLLEIGDTLEYTLVGRNIGSDPSVETYLVDTLSNKVTYVPESIEIIHGPNLGAKTDVGGDDQAEFLDVENAVLVNIGVGATGLIGGEVANSPTGVDSTVVTFRAVVNDDCVSLVCNNVVDNQALIFGTGDVSGHVISSESTPGTLDPFGCPIVGRTEIAVDVSSCTFPPDTTVANYCEGVLFEDFPYDESGYDYFDNTFSLATEAVAAETYYAIYEVNASCGDTIEIIVTNYWQTPTTADAGADTDVCIDPGTATLSGNDPLVGSGLWTVITGGGALTDASLFNSGITGATAGENTFRWTISNGTDCPVSFDEVTLEGNESPLTPDAGLDQELCGVGTATLAAVDPIIGLGVWSVILGGATVTDPDLFDSEVTGLTPGENTFRWTVTNGACPAVSDEVIYTLLADSDGDAVCNSIDLDDDNDGLPDDVEGDGDLDGDGIPNRLDLDSDNDGLADLVEGGGTDADGDGTVDGFTDLDGNGLDDAIEASPLPYPDSDGDGVKNTDDLDSDNDGLADVLEAGGEDGDGNGILDDVSDIDGDGFADDVDTDDNTIPGTGDGGISWDDLDTDGDGIVNRLDLDSDNDGIPDVIEAGGEDADSNGLLDGFVDSDGDGFSDVVDTDAGGISLPAGNFDFDGFPNVVDLDSDNDGIPDLVEAGGTDADGNGILDVFTDTDNNGLSDELDADAGGTALPLPNTDGTGGRDIVDIDADGDGIPDNVEAQTSAGYTAASGTDANGNGLDDVYDPTEGGTPLPVVDTDGDDIPDYQDLDSDSDGEPDLLEGHDLDGDGTADSTPLGIDADNDGLDNAFDVLTLGVPTWVTNSGNGTVDPLTDGVFADADNPGVGDLDYRENDTDGDGIDNTVDLDDDNDGLPDDVEGGGDLDGDGIPNHLDLDSDNDGLADVVEAGGADADGDGRIDGFTDSDDDGLDDAVEASPLSNPDSDGDGIKDTDDLDSDNDGIADAIEAGGEDDDGNGRLDGFSDIDGDGFADDVDTDDNTMPGPGDGGVSLDDLDTDGDGLVNRLDLDSDNDGIPDVIEANGADADSDGILDGFVDSDGDGFSDVADTDAGGTSLVVSNFDFDGFPNMVDLDSDNDGIPDAVEAGGTDANGDGVLDDFTDSDNDGLSDVVDPDAGGTALPLPNTDGTGGADYVDIDADGDGIADNIEAQTSGGYIAASGTDVNNNGLDDAYDPGEGGTPLVLIDSDGDSTPDYQDLDSDNDGESDALEGYDLDGDGVADTLPLGLDDDNDGLDNAFDAITLGVPTSSTNAGNGTVDPLTDGVLADADNPGVGDLDFRENDSDNDGVMDALDLDNDNDGIPDAEEDANEDGDNNPWTNPTDSDGDGIPDVLDLDSDNDGIPDVVEAGGTDANNDGKVDELNPDGSLINDTDNDGLADSYDADNGGTAIPNPDTDGDGVPDVTDLDSDNDGLYDLVEAGGTDADNNGRIDDFMDTDGDGIPDYADVDQTGGSDTNADGIDDDWQTEDDTDGDGISDEVDTDANGDGWDDDEGVSATPDSDADGIANQLDLDSDNDGLPDVVESGGTDANGDGRIDDFSDADGDGANDTAMTDGLLDSDADGVVDHIDLDSDNDGITDAEENGLPDANSDGRIDDFTDANGDGWTDDNGLSDPVNTDSDDLPDYLDSDSDNDGINDVTEGNGTDSNNDGIIDDFVDDNGDGLTDAGGLTPPDTDEDGADDYQDVDSDNDGVPDEDEYDSNNDGTGPDDTDGDGLADFRDDDDDNDGILTIDESDRDNDGVYDDCDNDGVPDYLDPDPCELIVPTAFSPDGDGINDYFVIQGIEAYPNAAVTVFNRWGNKVFESVGGYANDWDGTNMFGMTAGSRELPVGTYFCVLNLGDGSEVIKSYIFINR